jgi:hypothetical protein
LSKGTKKITNDETQSVKQVHQNRVLSTVRRKRWFVSKASSEENKRLGPLGRSGDDNDARKGESAREEAIIEAASEVAPVLGT